MNTATQNNNRKARDSTLPRITEGLRAECGKVVGDITEPITDGACSIIYACYECAEKGKGYIQTLRPPRRYQPATSVTNVNELREKFGTPREEK